LARGRSGSLCRVADGGGRVKLLSDYAQLHKICFEMGAEGQMERGAGGSARAGGVWFGMSAGR